MTLYITEILKITCIFTCIPSILWINSFADSFFASKLFQQKLFFYGVKLLKNLISLYPNILKIFFRYFTWVWRQPNFLLCEFCEITNDQILLRFVNYPDCFFFLFEERNLLSSIQCKSFCHLSRTKDWLNYRSYIRSKRTAGFIPQTQPWFTHRLGFSRYVPLAPTIKELET